MDLQVAELATFLVSRLRTTQSSSRLLVGLAGIPAAGKSTLAQLVVDKTNEIASGTAILVGLDGWHLTRAQLDAFPDAKLAHDRRGSHWTFDAPEYVSFVQLLREPVSAHSQAITAPSFDHAIKDPTPDTISIESCHRIVLIEGLYTLLSIEPWAQAGMLLDERWWVEVPEDDAKRRLVKRHVTSGVTKNMEEAIWRADENDMPNGRFIVQNLLEPTRVIQSIDDSTDI